MLFYFYHFCPVSAFRTYRFVNITFGRNWRRARRNLQRSLIRLTKFIIHSYSVQMRPMSSSDNPLSFCDEYLSDVLCILTVHLRCVEDRQLLDNVGVTIEIVSWPPFLHLRSLRDRNSVCLSVRLSVTHVLCDETKEHTADILTT